MELTYCLMMSEYNIVDNSLCFRIDRNATVAADISKVISHVVKSPTRRLLPLRISRRISEYLDVEQRQLDVNAPAVVEPLSAPVVPSCSYSRCLQRGAPHDDSVILELLVPPPRLPARRPAPSDVSSYDLNVLSRTNDVKNAVHYYVNLRNVVA
jgi:hypothetical protein